MPTLKKLPQFELLKFQRRRVIEFEGTALYFASPEDLILNKLRWRKQSGSEKQWRDVLGVLKVQAECLDFGYLAQGVWQLGIADELSQALEAGI